MEGPHRELRARLANTLGGDDADRETFFGQRSRRQVHAVAQTADAQRRFAIHRAAHLNLLNPQFLDFASDRHRDQLPFANDHFAGDGVLDIGAAHATANGFG